MAHTASFSLAKINSQVGIIGGHGKDQQQKEKQVDLNNHHENNGALYPQHNHYVVDELLQEEESYMHISESKDIAVEGRDGCVHSSNTVSANVSAYVADDSDFSTRKINKKNDGPMAQLNADDSVVESEGTEQEMQE